MAGDSGSSVKIIHVLLLVGKVVQSILYPTFCHRDTNRSRLETYIRHVPGFPYRQASRQQMLEY